MAIERGVDRQVFKRIERGAFSGLRSRLSAPAQPAIPPTPSTSRPMRWDRLKACEKRLCTMILGKPATATT